MLWCQVVPVLVLLCNAGVHVHVHAFTVSSDVGDIVGYEDKWDNVKVRVFLGIPYGKAPTGKRRFMPPEPRDRFTAPYEAKRFGPQCIQHIGVLMGFGIKKPNVSEDCLYLNVYVPDGGETKKAVMVWIHGGGFLFGSGEQYDGRMMATGGDVIILTVNYRLGLFGFFTTGDASASGNYGLLDQQLALKWVQKNIGAFGGDKDRVTIFGEAAGAAAVTWLMLAPSNQGLFNQVIAQSGAASTPFGMPNPNITSAYTKQLARAVGCYFSDSYKMATCLRMLNSSVFGHKTLFYPFQTPGSELPGGPRVDGTFIPNSPACTEQGKRIEDLPLFRTVNLLSGANKHEGEPSFSGFALGWKAETSQDLMQGVPKAAFEKVALFFAGRDDSNQVDTLWGRYAKGRSQMPDGRELMEFVGDGLMYESIMDFTNRHAKSATGSTYLYSFLPRPSEITGTLRSLIKPSIYADGAIHGDTLGYFFGGMKGKNASDWMGPKSYPGEKELSKTMITYWSNFAKFGNPSSPMAVPLQWPGYTIHKKEFIQFDIKNKKPDVRTNSDYRSRYMGYWSDIEPRLQEYCITAGASSVRFELFLITILLLTTVREFLL